MEGSTQETMRSAHASGIGLQSDSRKGDDVRRLQLQVEELQAALEHKRGQHEAMHVDYSRMKVCWTSGQASRFVSPTADPPPPSPSQDHYLGLEEEIRRLRAEKDELSWKLLHGSPMPPMSAPMQTDRPRSGSGGGMAAFSPSYQRSPDHSPFSSPVGTLRRSQSLRRPSKPNTFG